MDHSFEDIEVKENALELLEEALRRKRKPCMIGTGSMSDPYIPLETELRMTRKSLELIEKYGFGVTMITKSDRILRDLDLLKKINDQTKTVVQMTLTTADEDLCKLLEPGVCTTSHRVAALKEFQKVGIPTVVWLCPIIPFLNDTEENIRAIVGFCADAGVKGIIHFGMGLTLREGNREFFYAQLDRCFPGLKEHYIHTYGNAYALLSPNARILEQVFRTECDKYGICRDNSRIFRYLSEFEEKEAQMRLF
jgi:DNA repair photolyase